MLGDTLNTHATLLLDLLTIEWTLCCVSKETGHKHLVLLQAFARALRRATEHDERRGGQIASSKGVLTQQ